MCIPYIEWMRNPHNFPLFLRKIDTDAETLQFKAAFCSLSLQKPEQSYYLAPFELQTKPFQISLAMAQD